MTSAGCRGSGAANPISGRRWARTWPRAGAPRISERLLVREGEQIGIQARANDRLVDIVKKVERGELKQDQRQISELRLN
jgi:hypothetical protein